MKKGKFIHRLAAAACCFSLAASPVALAEGEITIASWGGGYTDAQHKALFRPAAKAMGIVINEETFGGMSDVRLKVKAGAVEWDIVSSGSGSAARAAEEGLLEPLDYDIIDVSNFYPGLYLPHCVGNDVFSTVMAWNTATYGDNGPKNWADFWNVEKFPGKRSYRQQSGGRAGAGADGRRRPAGKSVRGAVHQGRHQAGAGQNPRTQAAHRRVVVVRSPARPIDERRRSGHGDRLERPL